MSKKTNLKFVEPSLQDQLNTAIEEEAATYEALQAAERRFAAKGDVRLAGAGIILVEQGAELSEERQIEQATGFHRRQIDFDERQHRASEELRSLGDLRYGHDEARRRVERLRREVERQVDERIARQELAGAIAAIAGTEAELSRLDAAAGRAQHQRREAEVAVVNAEQALAVAIEAQAQTHAAAIEQGHPPPRDEDVQNARAALQRARDVADATKSAAATIGTKHGSAERALQEQRRGIADLARAIAGTAVPTLFAEVRELHERLAAQRVVLMLLSDFAPDTISEEVADYLAAPVFTWGNQGETLDEHPAVVPWVRAIEALKTDANALLPQC